MTADPDSPLARAIRAFGLPEAVEFRSQRQLDYLLPAHSEGRPFVHVGTDRSPMIAFALARFPEVIDAYRSKPARKLSAPRPAVEAPPVDVWGLLARLAEHAPPELARQAADCLLASGQFFHPRVTDGTQAHHYGYDESRIVNLPGVPTLVRVRRPADRNEYGFPPLGDTEE